MIIGLTLSDLKLQISRLVAFLTKFRRKLARWRNGSEKSMKKKSKNMRRKSKKTLPNSMKSGTLKTTN